jgi:hypothetical protein
LKEEEWIEREYQDWLANKGALVYGEITVQVRCCCCLTLFATYFTTDTVPILLLQGFRGVARKLGLSRCSVYQCYCVTSTKVQILAPQELAGTTAGAQFTTALLVQKYKY